MESYCVKCRARTSTSNPKEVVLKNGRPAIAGVCAACGTTKYKLLKLK